jgi:hypothetical protein
MLWTRASPETYDLLVLQRGWTTAQYADWLADTLAANLLRAGTAGHGKTITRRSAWRSPAKATRPSGIPIRHSGRIAIQLGVTFCDHSSSWLTRADPPIWTAGGSSAAAG